MLLVLAYIIPLLVLLAHAPYNWLEKCYLHVHLKIIR